MVIVFDMDGVLAKYDEDIVEYMYDKNYFQTRTPMKKGLELVKNCMEKHNEVYILSKTPRFSQYGAVDKIEWIHKHLPDFPQDHIMIMPGELNMCKAEYLFNVIPFNEDEIYLLFDDYTKNCNEWENYGKQFKAVKVKNGINCKSKHKKRKVIELY